jgi:hypothetical protein
MVTNTSNRVDILLKKVKSQREQLKASYSGLLGEIITPFMDSPLDLMVVKPFETDTNFLALSITLNCMFVRFEERRAIKFWIRHIKALTDLGILNIRHNIFVGKFYWQFPETYYDDSNLIIKLSEESKIHTAVISDELFPRKYAGLVQEIDEFFDGEDLPNIVIDQGPKNG